MKVFPVETGFFKLDGGAMFGIVPKQLWAKLNPPDELNLCTWSMRCLLIDTGERRILVDTGMGNKQDEKFRSHFHPHGTDSLLGSLDKLGYSAEDITDVLLTHLHFDHVGGAVSRTETGDLVPTFPNATYWTNEKHYQWALEPNAREKASFLKENFVPLEEAGVLRFIDIGEEDYEWLPGIRLRLVYGHTEAMMVVLISIGEKTMVYCADVMPSSFHLGMPYVMGYDLRPLETLKEKKRILEDALEHGQLLFFEHDPKTPSCTLKRNERGRVVMADSISVETYFDL